MNAAGGKGKEKARAGEPELRLMSRGVLRCAFLDFSENVPFILAYERHHRQPGAPAAAPLGRSQSQCAGGVAGGAAGGSASLTLPLVHMLMEVRCCGHVAGGGCVGPCFTRPSLTHSRVRTHAIFYAAKGLNQACA